MLVDDLIQKRTLAWEKLEEMKNTCEKEKREKSEDEIKEAHTILDEIDELTGKIETEERIQKTGDFLKQPTSEPHLDDVTHDPEEGKRFKSFGEQLQAVQKAGTVMAGVPGKIDERLQIVDAEVRAISGMSESVPSDGGFLVQTDFATKLLEDIIATGVLIPKVDMIPISGNANGLKMNGIDQTSRKDGYRFGGVRAYWAAEAAEKTKSKPKWRQVELNLQKLICLYYATDELLMDAAALENRASAMFRSEMNFKGDDAIIRGTGAGQPLGILTSSAIVTVSAETNQTATTIKAENVEKMYARMLSDSISKAVWYINQDCWPQIFLLSHSVGAGGVPMFIPAGGLSNAPFGTLLGRPIQPIEHCETLGTVGDIIFADLSHYLMISKGGIQSASSIHVRFIYDESVFRFVWRLDGQPDRAAALTPYKGTNTVSPFVVLATR